MQSDKILFAFAEALIDLGAYKKNTETLWIVHMRYNETTTYVTGYFVYIIWSTEGLDSLKRIIQSFKFILVESLRKHLYTSMHTVKYYVLYSLMDASSKLETLFV